MSLDLAKAFLQAHQTCVIATVGADGKPEAATVGFSSDDKFVLFIGTNNQSRKYQNLITNPSIALVIGFEGTETVQIEGQAKEVEVGNDQLADRIQKHLEKVLGAKAFANKPGQTWFLITPTWLRHTNYKAESPIYETKDFS